MRRAGRILLVVLVSIACAGCDQLTKHMARQSLDPSETISFIHGVFSLQYAENPGAFLSLGAGVPEHIKVWIFTVLVGFLLAGLLVFLVRSREISGAQSVALSLLFGGGVGNLIDRIFNDGRVIDFMNLGIGSLRTGVFNVADMAIMAGSVWLCVNAVQTMERKKAN